MKTVQIQQQPAIVKYWHIIAFFLTSLIATVGLFCTLRSDVSGNIAFVKSSSKTLADHERNITKTQMEIVYIKESLLKIEGHNQKMNDKMDRLITMLIKQK